MTAPQITFEKYPNDIISKNALINSMVGDTERMKIYAEKGFQIPQAIPEEAWYAYQELVKRGFVNQLI